MQDTHEDSPVNGPTREELLESIDNTKLRALLESLEHPEAYDWARLFPRTSGMGAAGDIKRRLRMLKSVANRLEFLLYPNERIEFVTRGTFNSFAEQYFMGIWALTINRTLFLFTNYRVILINSDSKGRARAMMWQIPYDKLAKYSAGSMGRSVAFKLVNKKRYKFAGVPKRDRKVLRTFMTERIAQIQADQFQFPSHGARDSLCTECATPMPVANHTCQECGERYIHPRTPTIMSFIVPGLGDLYIGHRTIAMLEMFGFIFVLLGLIGIVVTDGLAAIPVVLIILFVMNGYDAVVTNHVAKKGKLPVRLAWRGH